MSSDWEARLGELPPGTHAVLFHRGPVAARRVAGRFAAEGLAHGHAVVLSADAAEVERITITLGAQGLDVDGENARDRLLLLHSDEEQAARLAGSLEYLLGWIEDQVKTSEVWIWNHWAGALTERGRWHDAMALEAAIGDLHGKATVLCHHDVANLGGENGQGRMDGLATLHDAVFVQDEDEAVAPRPAAEVPLP